MIPTDSWLQQTATDSLGRTFDWVRLLGRGGFGEVYLARMHSPSGLEQQVAVKLLPAGLAPDSRAVVRLRDEAHVLASLRHPVVLAPHDLAELAGRVALVTEFIEGEDLASCIDPHDPAPLPVSTQLEVLEQVASALEVAWQQLRLVHRDVKPQNIRIGRHGNVKLLDFGLASSDLAERAAHTSSDVLVGTIRYLAPERFDTQRDPTPASDVYSLGCVLFEGVAGTPFLSNASVPTLVQRIAQTEEWERSVEERLTVVPDPELRTLLSHMLAHDPSRRPTATEVRERCELLRTAHASTCPPLAVVSRPAVARGRARAALVLPNPVADRTRSPGRSPARTTRPVRGRECTRHDVCALPNGATDPVGRPHRMVGAWSGEVAVGQSPRRFGKPAAIAALALVLVALLILGVTRGNPPPPEHALAAAAPMPSPPEPSAVSAAAVEPVAEAPVPTSVPAPESPSRNREPPVATAELVEVWVRTQPYGHVTVGGQRWGTEDRKMRLPPGRHVLHLESYDQRYHAEVVVDIVAGRRHSLCWDLVKDAACSY